MSITITYTFPSEENAIEFMQRVAGLTRLPVEPRPFEHSVLSASEVAQQPVSVPVGAPNEPPAKKPRTKKAPLAEPVPVEPATSEHARLALTELMATKGMAACTKVLEDAGVKRISELTDYARFVAACKAVA